MRTTAHGWTIIDEAAGVRSLTYFFGGEGKANCFTAKLPSGKLLVISPASRISDEALDELASVAEVEALVANNGFHYFGLARWRERFPDARSFAAADARERIANNSGDAGELEPLSALAPLLGEGVAVIEAPGSKCGETWARVKIDGGYAWYASDILANMDELPSQFLARMLFKLTRSAPGYRVFNLATKLMFKDKQAGLRAMLADVREHPPIVLVPAHGGILSGEALAGETERLLAAAI